VPAVLAVRELAPPRDCLARGGGGGGRCVSRNNMPFGA